jgi:hypothetical protein
MFCPEIININAKNVKDNQMQISVLYSVNFQKYLQYN